MGRARDGDGRPRATRENALLLIAVIALVDRSTDVLRSCYGRSTYGQSDRRTTAEPPSNVRRTAGCRSSPASPSCSLPVVARNYSVDGGFYLTTSQFGSNFYIGNNPNADGTYASIRFGRGAPEFERLDAKEVAEEAVGRALSPSEVSSFWTGRALRLHHLPAGGMAEAHRPQDPAALQPHRDARYREPGELRGVLDAARGARLGRAFRAAGAARGARDDRDVAGSPAAVDRLRAGARLRRQRRDVLRVRALPVSAGAVPDAVCGRTLRFTSSRRIVASASRSGFASSWQLAAARDRGCHLCELARVVVDAHDGDHREQPRHGAASNRSATTRRSRTTSARSRCGRTTRPATTTLARRCAPPAGSTKRSPATSRRSSSSPTSPAPATTSPTRCSNRARPAIRWRASAARSKPIRIPSRRTTISASRSPTSGDAAGAIAEFRAALAIDDRSVHAHRNLGNMLIDAGAARGGHGASRARRSRWRRRSRKRSTTSARSCCRIRTSPARPRDSKRR